MSDPQVPVGRTDEYDSAATEYDSAATPAADRRDAVPEPPGAVQRGTAPGRTVRDEMEPERPDRTARDVMEPAEPGRAVRDVMEPEHPDRTARDVMEPDPLAQAPETD